MTETLETSLGFVDATTLAGYCRDRQNPTRRFIIEILVDGRSIAVLRADEYCPQFAVNDHARCNYGFTFNLSAALQETVGTIDVQLANLGTPIGERIILSQRPRIDISLAAPGEVKTLGGLKLAGWVRAIGPRPPEVRFVCEGEEIAATICRHWIKVAAAGEARSMPAFELTLPSVLADGRRHDVFAYNSLGVPLAGSPASVKAGATPVTA